MGSLLPKVLPFWRTTGNKYRPPPGQEHTARLFDTKLYGTYSTTPQRSSQRRTNPPINAKVRLGQNAAVSEYQQELVNV